MPSVGGFGGNLGVAGTIKAVDSGANIALNVRRLREEIDRVRYKRQKELKVLARAKAVTDEQRTKHKMADGSVSSSISEYENQGKVQDSLDYSDRFNSVYDNMLNEHGANSDMRAVLDKYAGKTNMTEAEYKKFSREADRSLAQAKFSATNDARGYMKTKTFTDPYTQKPITRSYYDVPAYMASQAHLKIPVDAKFVEKMWEHNEKVDSYIDELRPESKDLIKARTDIATEAGKLGKVTTQYSKSEGSSKGGVDLSMGNMKFSSKREDPNALVSKVAESKDLSQSIADNSVTSDKLAAQMQSSPNNIVYGATKGGNQQVTSRLLQAKGNKDLVNKHIRDILARANGIPKTKVNPDTGEVVHIEANPLKLSAIEGIVTMMESGAPLPEDLGGFVHDGYLNWLNDDTVSLDDRQQMNDKLRNTSIKSSDLVQEGTGSGTMKSKSGSRTGLEDAKSFEDIGKGQFLRATQILDKFDTADYNATLKSDPEIVELYNRMKLLMGE